MDKESHDRPVREALVAHARHTQHGKSLGERQLTAVEYERVLKAWRGDAQAADTLLGPAASDFKIAPHRYVMGGGANPWFHEAQLRFLPQTKAQRFLQKRLYAQVAKPAASGLNEMAGTRRSLKGVKSRKGSVADRLWEPPEVLGDPSIVLVPGKDG